MVNIDIALSTSSLQRAVNKLRNLSDSLQRKSNYCAMQLAKEGESELATQITFIADFDGNDAGTIDSLMTDNGAELHWRGDQVDFLEFGTGPTGNVLPYNDEGAKPSYWEYRTSPWYYYNATIGATIETYGIPAYAPMLNTAIKLADKETILSKYKGILSRRG